MRRFGAHRRRPGRTRQSRAPGFQELVGIDGRARTGVGTAGSGLYPARRLALAGAQPRLGIGWWSFSFSQPLAMR
jgi:hypothetical protein